MQAIYGDNKGFAVIAYGGSGHAWKQKFFKYPDELDGLIAKAEEQSTYTNIYFCPHLFTARNKRKESAAEVMALWLDKDSGPVDEIKPKPTYCWMTSEGKHHALWLLNKPADPEEAEVITKYLAYTIPGGDRGCWNLGRVIRFPQSTNFKYYPPVIGELLWDDGPTYNISELTPKEKGELEVAVEEAAKHKAPPMPKNIPSFTEAILAFGQRIPSTVWELLREVPGPKDDWSMNLWKLERQLAEAGIPAEHTFAIVKDSPWNKYKRDGRPDNHLWEEIHRASLEKGPYQEGPETLPWVSIDELMLYSERPSWMIEGAWMHQNVGWIAGVGKSYKTVISTDLALSVASGTSFLDRFPVLSEGPVLIVQEEDPVWRVAHRIQVMSQQKDISHLKLSNDNRSLVLEITPAKIPLFVSIGGGLLFKDDSRMEQLERAIDKHRPLLVVLDPLFMISAGMDEFKAGEMAGSLNILKHWRNRFRCAFAVVHHYRKATGSAVERLYGSQALYSWSENNLFVSRLEEGDNVVVMDRDIKDARRIEEKIKVVFNDIDESYDFVVSDYAPTTGKKGGAKDKIVSFIRSVPLGQSISRQEIVTATGTSGKWVSKVLDNLENDGCVITETRGQGGQTVVRAVEGIYKIENFDSIEEGGILL